MQDIKVFGHPFGLNPREDFWTNVWQVGMQTIAQESERYKCIFGWINIQALNKIYVMVQSRE